MEEAKWLHLTIRSRVNLFAIMDTKIGMAARGP